MPDLADRANFDRLFAWLRESLPEPPNRDWVVLEAGHGIRGWSHLYHEYFDQVYGADIEDYSEFHPGVESITCDFTKEIPLPDKSVDLIVCHSVLEHVADVGATILHFDRILKIGGYAFLTVSPLYYSAAGSHIFQPVQVSRWEHLDPSSPYYMLDNPLPEASTKGHDLNQMTWAEFLAATGAVPWSVVRSYIRGDGREVPAYVPAEIPDNDLRIVEFRYLARKEWHLPDLPRG